MVDNRFPGIGVIRFIPDNIRNHSISKHTAGIQNQQSKISNSLAVSSTSCPQTSTVRYSRQKCKSPVSMAVRGSLIIQSRFALFSCICFLSQSFLISLLYSGVKFITHAPDADNISRRIRRYLKLLTETAEQIVDRSFVITYKIYLIFFNLTFPLAIPSD